MKCAMNKILATACLLLSMTAHADEKQLYTNGEGCDLREVGDAIKPNPVILKGKPESEGSNTCMVTIPKKEFHNKFKMCFMSGIRLGAGGFCFQHVDMYGDDISFEFSKNIECRYTCITK